jgi:hypothetical protein
MNEVLRYALLLIPPVLALILAWIVRTQAHWDRLRHQAGKQTGKPI